MIATSWEARRARVEEAVAKAQKERAERRFADVRQLAHSLLFDYHDAIKDLPGATRVRERLVKDALVNLDRLAAEAHGDPALQRDLAAAYERVGDVHGQAYSASFGDRAGATQSYQKALRIREALAQASPGDLQTKLELADIYRKLGIELLDTSEAARGLEYLHKSLSLHTELAGEAPNDWQVQTDLAAIHNAIGSALEDRSEMAAALEHHRTALTIREKLLELKPADQANRRGLSVSYENIGRVLSLTNDVRGALENNAKAMALREALLAEPRVGPGLDHGDRSVAAQRRPVDLTERGEQQPDPRRVRRHRTAAIDRRAVPAIALDDHDQVEAAHPTGEQGQQLIALAVRIVGRIDRRAPRGSAYANLECDRHRIGDAGDRERPPPQRAQPGARCVGVDPDRPADRALDAARIAEPVVARRQVVEPRDPTEPDVVERVRERAERVRDVLVLEPHPRDAARGVAGVPCARRLAFDPGGLAPRRDGVRVVVVIVGAEPEAHLGFVIDADRDHRPGAVVA